MSQGECDPCGVDVFGVRFPGALPPAIHIHPLRGGFSLALYIICENGLVAAAGGGGAGATGPRRGGFAVSALGRRCDDGELHGVVTAAALRASDLLARLHHQLFERLLAIVANVFVNRHGDCRLPDKKQIPHSVRDDSF